MYIYNENKTIENKNDLIDNIEKYFEDDDYSSKD
jgi:hypothetical protein